jgi:hypothetical protein
VGSVSSESTGLAAVVGVDCFGDFAADWAAIASAEEIGADIFVENGKGRGWKASLKDFFVVGVKRGVTESIRLRLQERSWEQLGVTVECARTREVSSRCRVEAQTLEHHE